MKVLIGLVMGLLSGFMIYMLLAMAFPTEETGPGFVAIAFFGGWTLSSYFLIRGARSVSRVFSRGFLLGAAEWFAVIPAGMILSGRALSETVSEAGGAQASTAEVAGATLGAGFMSFLTGGVAIGMVFLCLLGFLVFFLMGREMKPEHVGPTKSCPECAELVQAAAKRCKHCGVIFA